MEPRHPALHRSATSLSFAVWIYAKFIDHSPVLVFLCMLLVPAGFAYGLWLPHTVDPQQLNFF